MALPHEETEFQLSYYNSDTCWINIDAFLRVFGLDRAAAQFEKLWVDMPALPEMTYEYVVVPRTRGRSLKSLHNWTGG